MSDIDGAQATLVEAEAKAAELQVRLERTREQAEANRSKARDLAFAAEGQDDEAARRLSTKLIADAVKLDEEIEYRLQPAVDEARRRVSAARDVETREAQRVKAQKAHDLASELKALGARIDAGFAQASDAKREFGGIMLELQKLGAPTPSSRTASAAASRSAMGPKS